ncbi:hypothetical protein [Streptomyces sp. NPDC047525]|uniref:hypothetical protein n=1 Tax=Streptomyces sp. NPDC047525 TaxID=3155264 RepID=UPI0033FF1654
MLRLPGVRHPDGYAVARLLPATATRRSAREARRLLAAFVAEKGQTPLDHGRVTRDAFVWPLYWTHTAQRPEGVGVLLLVPGDLPEAYRNRKNGGDLGAMAAALAPVWCADLPGMIRTAQQYLESGVPAAWMREAEADDELD